MKDDFLPNLGVRINMVVEGQTEERFVNELMAPHFGLRGAEVIARCITTSRQKGRPFRGGMPSYEKVRYDLLGWIREDTGAYVTTMFDLYQIDTGFPSYAESRNLTNGYDQAVCLETGLDEDIDNSRFIPYIQIHEFEALLFSDANAIEDDMMNRGRPSRRDKLRAITEEFSSPEDINNGFETAPSKRLAKLYKGYENIKITAGTNITKSIGLTTIRECCPHFDEWISNLESLDPLNN